MFISDVMDVPKSRNKKRQVENDRCHDHVCQCSWVRRIARASYSFDGSAQLDFCSVLHLWRFNASQTCVILQLSWSRTLTHPCVIEYACSFDTFTFPLGQSSWKSIVIWAIKLYQWNAQTTFIYHIHCISTEVTFLCLVPWHVNFWLISIARQLHLSPMQWSE